MYFAEVMAIFPVYYAYRIKQFRIIPVLILKTEHQFNTFLVIYHTSEKAKIILL